MARSKAYSRATQRRLKSHRTAVGRWLTRKRKAVKFSQRRLADALGYKSVVSISDVECGRTRVPVQRLEAWAKALKVPLAEFLATVVVERGRLPR